jgi:hypothetical protein
MAAAVGFGTGRPAASAKNFFVPFPRSIITDTDVTTLQRKEQQNQTIRISIIEINNSFNFISAPLKYK